MRILLVDDNQQLRDTRAIMLSTHGYQVESVRDTTEACLRWHANRPNLVLLALSEAADRTFAKCPGIRESMPTQRVGYLLAQSQYLCPVFLDGGVILKGEGPEDFLGRVQEILSGVLDAPVGAPQGAGGAGERQTTGE
jgi:DNA-binding NarL/FixJ family response regulator